MAMVVKNNMSAVRTLNTLNQNSNALSKSLSRVSSGMKINSAQDDAAGYAISERMRVRIRSLDQANQNTQNDSSLMKTAEGSVGNTVELLRALKEKAINAANDSNTDEDRQTIQKELNQFIDQIDDNALVQFNGKYLVDGSKNNATLDTKTILLNQSLAKGTKASDALTTYANRAGDSLEILTTDKWQVSWVQNGTIVTSSGTVGTNSLSDILAATKDKNGNPTPGIAAATDENGLIGNSDLMGAYNKVSDAPAETAGVSDFTDIAAMFPNAEKIVGSDGAEVTDLSTTTPTNFPLTATYYKADEDGNPEAVEFTIDKDSSGKFAVTVPENFETGTELYAAKDTESEYVKDVSAPANNEAGAASSDIAALLGMETTDLEAAVAAGGSKTLADLGFTKEIYTESGGTYKAVDLTKASVHRGSAADSAKFYLYDDASTAAAYTNNTQFYVANPDKVAEGEDKQPLVVDKFHKAVYTPDKTEGIAFVANDAGVGKQVSGLTINIMDQDGNVKKAANAALDQFKQYQRAENKTGDMSLNFHIGSEANVAIKVGLGDMRAEALGLKGSTGERILVTTKENANASINVIENALTKALDQQTTIGAIEARLEYTATNLTTSSENVQAAESTIRDADMAKEMTNYTKNNVLLQAAQAMLAQANQNSSAVLSLLQ